MSNKKINVEKVELEKYNFSTVEELLLFRTSKILVHVKTLTEESLQYITSKFSVEEGIITAKVWEITLTGKSKIKEHIKETCPELVDGEITILTRKRLKELRNKERVRICNSMGIYKGKQIQFNRLDSFLNNIWSNYYNYFPTRVAIEKMKKPPKELNYSHRNLILSSLGYDSYQDYLSSDLWKTIRKQALRRDDYKCKLCGDKAAQVHHRVYDENTLTGDDIRTLVSLCSECHTHIEFTPEGNKRSLQHASKVCSQLITPFNCRTSKLSKRELYRDYPTLCEKRISDLAELSKKKQSKALSKLAKNRRRKLSKMKSSNGNIW